MLVRRPRRLQNQVWVFVIRKFTPQSCRLAQSHGHRLDKRVFRGDGLAGWSFYIFRHDLRQPAGSVSTRFLSRQFAQRENLYAQFIDEAARLMADSLEQDVVKPSTLVPIYGLENRIQLNASDEVVQAARGDLVFLAAPDPGALQLEARGPCRAPGPGAVQSSRLECSRKSALQGVSSPECNYHKLTDPLVLQLFLRGFARRNPLFLGFDVNDHGRLT